MTAIEAIILPYAVITRATAILYMRHIHCCVGSRLSVFMELDQLVRSLVPRNPLRILGASILLRPVLIAFHVMISDALNRFSEWLFVIPRHMDLISMASPG